MLEITRPGEHVDRFRLIECRASSAMSSVWRAEDRRTGRPVAIKLVPRGTAAASRALAGLEHPHIARVIALGEAATFDFVAMDWFEGRPLTAWLAEQADRRPRWRTALDALVQAGAGLLAAHRAGAVHGDFKPANVLVDARGHTKVIDFCGAACSAGHTEAYLAPERMYGARPSPKSDQFSFCVTAYEALYRRAPFSGRTQRLLGQVRPAPRGHAPDALYEPLQRGLHSSPEHRHASLDTLLRALPAGRRTASARLSPPAWGA